MSISLNRINIVTMSQQIADSNGADEKANPTNPPEPSQKTTKPTENRPCVIVLAENTVIGGKAMGTNSDLNTRVVINRGKDTNPAMGFVLDFPLGANNEDIGFGVSHRFDHRVGGIVPVDHFSLQVSVHNSILNHRVLTERFQVNFPRGGVQIRVSMLPSGHPLVDLKVKKSVVQIDVTLQDDAKVTVRGFGIPFANKGHVSESWVNSSVPLAGSMTLLNLLEQRTFSFLVDWHEKEAIKSWDESALGPPFSYPYGDDHEWNFERYETLLPANKVSHTPNSLYGELSMSSPVHTLIQLCYYHALQRLSLIHI